MPKNNIPITDLLWNTATPDEFAVRIMNSENGEFLAVIKKEVTGKRFRTKAEMLNSIMEGTRKYILSRKTPPSVRQKLWLTCKEWVDRIADELGVDTDYSFEECLSKPIVEEPEIALIKALHTNDPKTKKDLGEELGESEKSVQTYLRRICPDLQQAGKRAAPCRVCGQELHAEITKTTDTFIDPSDGRTIRYNKYQMKDRMSPIFLQQNTMQVGHLLTALQKNCDNECDIVCRETALDIWCQLSDEVKDRIREVYCKRDPEFALFIDEIDSECEEGRLLAFHTEEGLWDYLSPRNLLESAFKSGQYYSFKIKKNGNVQKLSNVRVFWAEGGGDNWIAVPRGETKESINCTRFCSDDLHGPIEK